MGTITLGFTPVRPIRLLRSCDGRRRTVRLRTSGRTSKDLERLATSIKGRKGAVIESPECSATRQLGSTRLPLLRMPVFWLVMTLSGLLGLAISFTSMWFLHQTSATTYSLVGSLNKIPLSIIGIVVFKVPTSLQNFVSILFGLLAGVFFAKAKMRERSQS